MSAHRTQVIQLYLFLYGICLYREKHFRCAASIQLHPVEGVVGCHVVLKECFYSCK